MDDDSNNESTGANERIALESFENKGNAESTINENDVPMEELDDAETSKLNHNTLSNNHTEDKKDKNDLSTSNSLKNASDDVKITETSTQMEADVTAGTSTNSKPSAVRRPAGTKPKTNRFAKRNYRVQVLSSSSSSSNRSTPELRNHSESTETTNPTNGDNDHHSDHDDDDVDDDWEGEDDDDNDDDDDEDSSGSSFGYPQMAGFDSEESNQSKSKADNEAIRSAILGKRKPDYKMNVAYEVLKREHGLSSRSLNSVCDRSSLAFQKRIYGSRQMVEKLKLLYSLQDHDGCVNSLNFNKAGTLLASGSDDLKINLWDWASNKIKCSVNSGHHSNVFQTKFIEFGGGPEINIASSGRDGQVRYITIPPGGCSTDSRSTVLLKHSGAVHKISPSPHLPYEILTAGEDGNVFRCDLRSVRAEKVCTVKVKKRKVPLYSIAHNPHEPHFCVCGRDKFVRVYDKRNTKDALFMMYPDHLENKKAFNVHITCAVYNSSGSEILASYSDEDIYSFNSRLYRDGEFIHRYQGHNNNKTIKGVNYFGLNSEYVVSGSDCGNFFIWDTESEAILNWRKADILGVVNCLEPHPFFPVLATSGLDNYVKIWAPINDEYPPKMDGLEKCLKNNARRTTRSALFDDRTLYLFVRQCLRGRWQNSRNGDCPIVEDFTSSDSESEENDCDLDDENLRSPNFPPCNPQ